MLTGKVITLGICACSPAVDALKLIKMLRKLNAEVHVVMTPNATHFVTPLMVQREAGTPLQIDQFELPRAYDMNHQSLSVKSDLLVIAPASADIIGKAANGIADNLLSTNILSAKSPIVIATHINPTMYGKASVQRNIEQLKEDGFIFVENTTSKFPSLFPELGMIVEVITKELVNSEE